MVPMRTPDSDDDASEGGGSLADGFGTVASGDGEDADDTNFGEGSGEASEAADALQAGTAEELVDDGETQVFLDPQDSYTDTDLDLTGDGLVDGADLHEAVTGFFDFSVEDDGSYGESAHGHDDGSDDGELAGDADAGDGGLFGLFDA